MAAEMEGRPVGVDVEHYGGKGEVGKRPTTLPGAPAQPVFPITMTSQYQLPLTGVSHHLIPHHTTVLTFMASKSKSEMNARQMGGKNFRRLQEMEAT